MDNRKKAHAIQSLRRSTYKWPGRWQAEKRSRIGRGEYYCEICGLVCRKKDTQLDHIEPVVDPNKGWEGFDQFIDRLLVDETGWQRICVSCHKEKTAIENATRLKTKHAKNPPKKKKKA